jgi:glycosyltransferase involved in cell wall biosynthesis
MNPLVSICVPTRNRAAALRHSLESICGQDYPALDILISDNASDDGTQDVALAAARADSRVRYVRHPQNIGLYGNHNFCLDESRGEFVCLFHDHDERASSLVSTYVDFLQTHPTVGIVCADWNLVNADGRILAPRVYGVPEVISGLDYITQTMRSGRSAIGLPGAMIRRSALGDLRFDEQAPVGFGDFVVWFRLAERVDVGHINRRLWGWRQDPRSESARTIESMARDYCENLSRYCDEHLARWPQHAALVGEWQRSIHKYLFWALLFEIGLYCKQRRGDAPSDDPTVFEIMDYRLTPEQFRWAMEQLRAHEGGALDRIVRLLTWAFVGARFTWPLAWATEHHRAARALLGLSERHAPPLREGRRSS